MKIYATRHGQTDYNFRDVICGVSPAELTEKGIADAKALAERVAGIGDIDVLIASPMKRAMDTARFTAEKLGLPIITDERLIEWNYGDYEGKPRFANGFPEAKKSFGCKMPGGGESLLGLAHRVYSALDDIRVKYAGKNVLIVCHGGVCRVIEAYFHDMTTDEFMHFFMGNCELREYEID